MTISIRFRRLVSDARAIPILLVLLASARLDAQQRTRYASLMEALQSTAVLAGRGEPQNVVWLEGGRRFSFIGVNPQTGKSEIRAYDPATGRDTLLLSGEGLTFPGTTNPFLYEGFQWARDFKNIVFQANFQPIYRRSGTSDFYIYSLATRGLQLAGRGARTAELPRRLDARRRTERRHVCGRPRQA